MLLGCSYKLNLEHLRRSVRHRLTIQQSVARHPYSNYCKVMQSWDLHDMGCLDILNKEGCSLLPLNPVTSIEDDDPPNKCCCYSRNWVDKV